MNNTLTLLLGVINHSPADSINYRIADYLLHHIGEIDHLSTSYLAKQCHVSKSAISRFCKTIGLEDFLDLQLMLRSSHYLLEMSAFSYPFEQYVKDIKNNMTLLSAVSTSELITDLYRYQSVSVMGHMQSHLAASNLQYSLSQFGRFVRCSDQIQEQKEMILQARNQDLIIIFSASGKFLERLFVRQEQFQRCKARIYVISFEPKSVLPSFIYQWITLPSVAHQSVMTVMFMIFSQKIFFDYMRYIQSVSENETENINLK